MASLAPVRRPPSLRHESTLHQTRLSRFGCDSRRQCQPRAGNLNFLEGGGVHRGLQWMLPGLRAPGPWQVTGLPFANKTLLDLNKLARESPSLPNCGPAVKGPDGSWPVYIKCASSCGSSLASLCPHKPSQWTVHFLFLSPFVVSASVRKAAWAAAGERDTGRRHDSGPALARAVVRRTHSGGAGQRKLGDHPAVLLRAFPPYPWTTGRSTGTASAPGPSGLRDTARQRLGPAQRRPRTTGRLRLSAGRAYDSRLLLHHDESRLQRAAQPFVAGPCGSWRPRDHYQ